MNKDRIIIQLIVGLSVLIIVQLLLIFISSKELVFEALGFSTISDFGTISESVSTFLVGILSAVLIYISFKAQTKANNKQFEIIEIQKKDLEEQRRVFEEEKRKNDRKEKLEEITNSIDRFLREVNEFNYRSSSGSILKGGLGVFFLIQEIGERLQNRDNGDPFDNYEIGFLKTIALQAKQTLLIIHESNLSFNERKSQIEEFDRIFSSRVAYNFSEIAVYYVSDPTRQFHVEQNFLEDFKACYDLLKYYYPVSSFFRYCLKIKSVELVGGNFYWNDLAFSMYHERYFSYPKFDILEEDITDHTDDLLEILGHLVSLVGEYKIQLAENHKEWIMATRISIENGIRINEAVFEKFEVPEELLQSVVKNYHNYNNYDIDQLLTLFKLTVELFKRNLWASSTSLLSLKTILYNCVEVFSIIEGIDNFEFQRVEYQLLAK
jgi:hypothetical protein